MATIDIAGVEKNYGAFAALRGIDLHVDDGEFVSLLGPSGCGKTSLLRSIAGLEEIQGGSISVGGVAMSRSGYTMPPERRNLGLIFQSYALWPHMNVYKNLAYGLRLRGWKRDAIPDRIDECLTLVGLDGLGSRYPSELSGGQMQRVAVARSLAPKPAVLLFDEPLSNLDAKLRESMRFELRRIQKEVGTTAVYVTHDQAEAMVISDRIVLMNHGEIIQEGNARQLYERPESAFAARFLGFSNLLPGRLQSSSAGSNGVSSVQLDVGSGHVIPAVVRESLRGAEELFVSVRPEHVRVEKGGRSYADRAQLPGRITDLVYSGNLGDVFVDVGGFRLRAQVLPHEVMHLEVGDEVLCCFDPASAWVVGSDDEGSTDDTNGLEPDSVGPEAVISVPAHS